MIDTVIGKEEEKHSLMDKKFVVVGESAPYILLMNNHHYIHVSFLFLF